MYNLASWKLVTLAALSAMILFSASTYVMPPMTAHAQMSQKTICVLQPIDQSIPFRIVNMTEKVLTQHNETFAYIGLVQELTDKNNTGCNYVIQFQRAVNSNYVWVDKTVHYTISGTTLTLYTDKTPIELPDSISSVMSSPGALNAGGNPNTPGTKASGGGDTFAPIMTNPLCFAEAIATFHLTLNGFAGYETCNPYAGTQTVSDETPFYVLHKSLEHALAKMHL
ncbi:MAG: hypothetical protein KGH88_09540 [Thaumarchaeota archaeon]|nr:hypothetical protein [Nitrososphaerota archaeon]